MFSHFRERNPVARIKTAHKAIEINPENACAYILLAEEEATTISKFSDVFNTLKDYAFISYSRS
jgi:ST7 protein